MKEIFMCKLKINYIYFIASYFVGIFLIYWGLWEIISTIIIVYISLFLLLLEYVLFCTTVQITCYFDFIIVNRVGLFKKRKIYCEDIIGFELKDVFSGPSPIVIKIKKGDGVKTIKANAFFPSKKQKTILRKYFDELLNSPTSPCVSK